MEDSQCSAAASVPRTVQSVARAAQLLKALGRLTRPASLSELARKVGLSKPTAYNLLKTLESEGLISKSSDAKYTLDWGLYELGATVATSVELARVSRFHLDRLAEITGEAALLGILDGESVLYLDRGQGSDAFSMVANVGRRSALHSTASGKILLANRESDFIQAFLKRKLKAFTSKTITDPAQLRAELTTAARRGYAICWEEQEIGLSSISVPLRDGSGLVQAAMTIAAPSNRLNGTTLSHYLVALQTEASGAEKRLAIRSR